MGISFSGKIASSVTETDCLHWNIPEGISPHDAAAIPLAYITVSPSYITYNSVIRYTALGYNCTTFCTLFQLRVQIFYNGM